jgi:hypothetical protein
MQNIKTVFPFIERGNLNTKMYTTSKETITC